MDRCGSGRFAQVMMSWRDRKKCCRNSVRNCEFLKYFFNLFKARGPDFKKKSKIGPIKTVDVYPLLCDLLHIKCNPNNGSIIPFQEARSFAENESKFCYFIQITLFALLYFI